MTGVRRAIREGRFEEFREDFYRRREPVLVEPLAEDAVN